jgi:cyclic pyranopterin phosphate synthase
MVDVGEKPATRREARARAVVRMAAETRRRIDDGKVPKGEVFAVARIAGIQAAKRTAELIPLCHPLPLEQVTVSFRWLDGAPRGHALLEVEAAAVVTAKTGVEMEALTAAAVAALAVYDMCKSLDRSMTVERVELVLKKGGRSGTWTRSRGR